jgi:hemerythrin-like domain-containing protein
MSMKATEILMDEHRVIERVISALERACARIERGEAMRPGFFLEASDFVAGFADGCHHAKEEGVLFEAMAAEGMPRDGGPIAVMLMEHDDGRGYNRRMREAAQRLAAGDQAALAELVSNARGYGALLRQHIMKEDQVLFPMADEIIPPEKHGLLHERFRDVERHQAGEGVHEKYLALAGRLAAEAGGE